MKGKGKGKEDEVKQYISEYPQELYKNKKRNIIKGNKEIFLEIKQEKTHQRVQKSVERCCV